jgi:2-dehydro-3-deoxyglucarate aldolase
MRNNLVREKLKNNQPTIGCALGLGSPNVAELLATAGFDWLVIETEHNGLDSAEVEHMLRAMNGSETIPLVRVPSSDQVFIQRALDMGAMGILVPMVRTASEAEAIVRATRYPPEGIRSFGPLRASRYGMDNEDYFKRANENTLVVLILETKEAVKNLESICAVPGIDVVYVGPYDLCLSLGLNPMRQPYREIDEVLEIMLRAREKTGVALGIGVSNAEQLGNRQAQGFTYLNYNSDYRFLSAAAQAAVAVFKERVG